MVDFEKLMLDMREEAIRKTHKKMVERNPDQKDLLDKMLQAKLKSIGRGD